MRLHLHQKRKRLFKTKREPLAQQLSRPGIQTLDGLLIRIFGKPKRPKND